MPPPAAAAVPMDCDPTSVPSASSTSSSSSPSSLLSGHLASIFTSHRSQSDGILKNLSKMLLAIKKSPNLLANRKYRCDNIAIKKFVMDIPGALAILKFVGYQTIELTDKKTPYLIVEEAQLATEEAKTKLDAAIEVVTNKLNELERAAAGSGDASAAGSKPAAASATAAPTLCIGGCGFHGSTETEGYCSLCFKKKFLATSPNKPKHNDPFVTPPKAGLALPSAALTKPAAAASSSSSSADSLGGGSSTEQKCLKHCGRFGSSAFKGFCQVCYERITAQGLKPPPKRWKCLFDGAMVKVRAIIRFNKGKKPVQENKSRCWICSKKIGITGFECRCRYVFCSQHRYMEQHDCRYDIKSLHRKETRAHTGRDENVYSRNRSSQLVSLSPYHHLQARS